MEDQGPWRRFDARLREAMIRHGPSDTLVGYWCCAFGIAGVIAGGLIAQFGESDRAFNKWAPALLCAIFGLYGVAFGLRVLRRSQNRAPEGP